MSGKINKSKLNLTIDMIMFVVLMGIAGIGFLMKYVLIPGFKRNEVYGRNVDLYFRGLDRHQWGSIHLILSFILLFLILLHIVFHWKQIVRIFKGMISNKIWRVILISLLVVITLVISVLPLFLNPEVKPDEPYHLYHNETGTHNTNDNDYHKIQAAGTAKISAQNKSDKVRHSHTKSEIEVYGYMTLNELAVKYDIPAEKLAQSIDVPIEFTNERLGRLRRTYNFQMNDLRRYIESNIESE
ncbi:MAG: DUF4405 domain-containing protein [Bacteroidetes bacterium]|jgi:hypothetical protein|nr:DUF4405 domain-containing protein [Bacteroidota bacterium]